MARLPKANMILAGFLAHVSLRAIILKFNFTCKQDGILWFLLILISAVVAIVTYMTSREKRTAQGVIAFVASFLLNFGGDHLGDMAVLCTSFKGQEHNGGANISDLFNEANDVYIDCSFSIMAVASIGICVHCLLKVTPQLTAVPDPEVFLLAVCAQSSVLKIIFLSEGHLDDLCFKSGGIGGWLLMLVVSCILAVITFIKTNKHFSATLCTLIGTFVLQLFSGATGQFAISCANHRNGYIYDASNIDAYWYAVLMLNGIVSIVMTVHFLKNHDGPPNRAMMVAQTTAVHATTNQYSGVYPMQQIFPASNLTPASYTPTASLAPQASNP